MGKKKEKKYAEPIATASKKIDYDSLTHSQRQAVKLFDDWYHTRKSKDNGILRIGGFAGTGKDYIIRYLLEQYKFTTEECYAVAYTGQAVNVMRANGILAKTIHSTFMKVTETPILDANGDPIYRSGIPLMKTKFRPLKKIPETVKLVVVNEASFLPKKLEDLISSYNVPIVEFGDPIQLPPVSGEQCFHMDNVDYFMTDIVRQERHSEIIDLATKIRNYEPINLKDYGNEVKFFWAQDSIKDTFFRLKPLFRGSDVIITATNKQRDTINKLYRENIIKTNSPFPVKGERVICRKNDWNTVLAGFPLTNGTTGYAVHTVSKSDVDPAHDLFFMDFKPDFVDDDYYDGLICDVKFLRDPCGAKDMNYYERMNPGKKFEYAHALTTHVVQGSSLDTIMFVDSFMKDAEYHMRLRYTAITRARHKVYYILPKSKYDGWTDLKFGGFRPDNY